MSGLKKKVNGQFVDVGESQKPLFRGAWSESQLSRQFDFINGLGDEFTVGSQGPGLHAVFTQTLTQLGLGGTPPSTFTNGVTLQLNYLGVGVLTELVLNLSSLNLKNISRVDLWMGKKGTSTAIRNGCVPRIVRNSTVAHTGPSGAANWYKTSIAASSTDTLRFQLYGTGTNDPPISSGQADMGVAGIQIFTTEEPYMLNEFVTHKSSMWKSLLDNNNQEPSAVSTQWEKAVDFPPVKGTTSSRPSPSETGAGFQYYDTDLGQPLWSDGTVWNNALGDPV